MQHLWLTALLSVICTLTSKGIPFLFSRLWLCFTECLYVHMINPEQGCLRLAWHAIIPESLRLGSCHLCSWCAWAPRWTREEPGGVQIGRRWEFLQWWEILCNHPLCCNMWVTRWRVASSQPVTTSVVRTWREQSKRAVWGLPAGGGKSQLSLALGVRIKCVHIHL